MKRIDDKIKEIEKKDSRYRWAYYIIVVLLLGFLWYASTTRKQMDLKDAQIGELTIKQSQIYKDLDSVNNETQKLYKDLKNSLQPEQYWTYIKDENSVDGYIEYLTNIWGIKRDSIDMNTAISNLKKTGPVGETGWLYIGNKTDNGEYVQPRKGQVAKIIWRRGKEQEDQMVLIENAKPIENDIIKMVKTTNRITYKKPNFSSRKNKEGWRPSSKAFVSQVKKNDAEVWVKIRYY